jgi:hypothetical protein
MKFFTFRFNSIANRSAAFQNWKRDNQCSSSSSFDGKCDLSTSATSASSDDESSVKESMKSSEAEDLGSDKSIVGGSEPSEAQKSNNVAKVTRRKFGTPMPRPFQTQHTSAAA